MFYRVSNIGAILAIFPYPINLLVIIFSWNILVGKYPSVREKTVLIGSRIDYPVLGNARLKKRGPTRDY